MRKTYTQAEINEMSEKKMLGLFERGSIDDDQVQRWYDNKEEGSWLAQDFIANELKYYI